VTARPRALLAALVTAALLGATPAAAAAACPKTSLGAVEHEVMCPVCGVPLELATDAPQAQRERAFIRRQIADCRSKDEIKAALAAQFGKTVLALPGDRAGGGKTFSDYAVYAIPAAALVAALAAIAFGLTRWRRGRGEPLPASGAPTTESTPADAKRLETDLERYDL
jgi:cytochrome c-type biogenesis protein CcmH/NrfF